MKPDLLNVLCCPECKGELRPANLECVGGLWRSGKLLCDCGMEYPIRNFIPRFVKTDEYVSSFSMQWTIHAQTQIDQGISSRSHDAFFEKTGFNPASLAGKLILDVGVGSGRFADIAARYGAEVIGVDLSYAVDAARETFSGRANIQLIQADVFRLPFRNEVFDFIYSIGVLHHTPDCKAAFQQLPALLAPAGEIAIWVYAKTLKFPQREHFIKDIVKDLGHRCSIRFSDTYRILTTRMNKKLLYWLCYVAVPYGYLARIPVVGSGLKVVFPMSIERKAHWRILDTFDWYSPRYQSKHTFEEVSSWFEEAGFKDIECSSIWPVSVKAKKSVVVAEQAS